MPSHEDPLVARATARVDATPNEVWDALVDPEAIRQYMFGTSVESDWREGGPIVWRGEWQGKAYEDKGEILRLEPGKLLRYSHFSPLSGLPDAPENYHTVTIGLDAEAGGTRVVLTQDGNSTTEAREHSEQIWRAMLDSLREYVERRAKGEAA